MNRASFTRHGASRWALALVIVVQLLCLGGLSVHLLTREPAVVVESTTQVEFTGRAFALVNDEESVVQKVTFRENNLARIDVLMEPADRRTSYEITVHIRASPEGPDIRTTSIDAGSITDRTYVPVIFPIIARSMGETYFVVIAGEKVLDEDAVSIWGTTCDCMLDAHLLRRGADADHGLPTSPTAPDKSDPSSRDDHTDILDAAMITYFIPNNGRVGKLQVLSDRLSYFKPAWLQSPYLLAYTSIALVAYALMLFAAVRTLTIAMTPSQRLRIHALLLIASLALPAAAFRLL